MTEYDHHLATIQYLAARYPDVYYHSDPTNSDPGRTSNLQKCPGHPDLFVYAPVGKWHGLALEIKSHWDKVYNETGGLRDSRRHLGQAAVLWHLSRVRFAADFAFGIDEAKFIIDEYFNGTFHITNWPMVFDRANHRQINKAVMSGHVLLAEMVEVRT